jgi:hypothetical protein
MALFFGSFQKGTACGAAWAPLLFMGRPEISPGVSFGEPIGHEVFG